MGDRNRTDRRRPVSWKNWRLFSSKVLFTEPSARLPKIAFDAAGSIAIK